jgi:hypothetical protein
MAEAVAVAGGAAGGSVDIDVPLPG